MIVINRAEANNLPKRYRLGINARQRAIFVYPRAWVTIVPTLWLLVCTLTAGLQKIFSVEPAIGFVAHARVFGDAAAAGKLLAPAKTIEEMHPVIVNDYVVPTLSPLFVAVVPPLIVYGVIPLLPRLRH